jgi:hypothetical protein
MYTVIVLAERLKLTFANKGILFIVVIVTIAAAAVPARLCLLIPVLLKMWNFCTVKKK